jgi:glycosyltransferase involved in cell wall biosynthesis
MRILYIVGSMERGGVETLVRDWCQALHGSGLECSVVCTLSRSGDYLADLEQIGVPVLELKWTGQSGIAFTVKLARLIRMMQIEVVHSQCAWSLPQQAFGARLGGAKRYVLTVHNVYANGTKTDEIRRWIGICLARQLIDEIIGVSDAVSAHTRKWLWLPDDEIRTIRNGIRLDQFSFSNDERGRVRESLGLSQDTPCLVNVASLSEKKNQDLLLRAMAEIVSRQPRAVLLLVGDGPLREKLKQTAIELCIDDHIVILGKRNDIPQILHASDIFVLSSTREGLPLALVEAQACGLPAVSTRVGGVDEVVLHKKTGLLVPAGDTQAFANAVIKLLEQPETARAMGVAGKERMLRCFDAESCIGAYRTIYEQPT